MKIRRGFSLIELSICVVIIFILASTIAVNINSFEQTAKQEAEKLEAYIHDLMRKADRSHRGFAIIFKPEGIVWRWTDLRDENKNWNPIYWTDKNDEKYKKQIINNKFKVDCNYIQNELTYDSNKHAFSLPGRSFTVKRKSDNDKYSLVVHSKSGRIRLSENPADSSNDL